jgi:hypothetical protein
MTAAEIEFAGAFEEHERAFLSAQFNRCRFQLIRRAQRDPTVCLLTWASLHSPSRGPAPLRSIPMDAVYVLRGGRTLTRVQSTDEVERELGEPVGELNLRGLRRPNPILDGAKQALRGLIPWR